MSWFGDAEAWTLGSFSSYSQCCCMVKACVLNTFEYSYIGIQHNWILRQRVAIGLGLQNRKNNPLPVVLVTLQTEQIIHRNLKVPILNTGLTWVRPLAQVDQYCLKFLLAAFQMGVFPLLCAECFYACVKGEGAGKKDMLCNALWGSNYLPWISLKSLILYLNP